MTSGNQYQYLIIVPLPEGLRFVAYYTMSAVTNELKRWPLVKGVQLVDLKRQKLQLKDGSWQAFNTNETKEEGEMK